MSWSPASWRALPALHQPAYPDPQALASALATLASLPPLVRADEIETLKERLAHVYAGDALVLQGGDCAEAFADCRPERIAGQLALLARTAEAMGGHRLPAVRIGRLAGQFGKPRSAASEIVDGVRVTPFLGENVNGASLSERTPDPQRLVTAYFHAAASLNYMRANPEGAAAFTSHEGLILAAEERQTRFVPCLNGWYNLSAHMLWIGERTRALDGAHVEYFRGIANPIGLKLGPGADPCEVLELIRTLDPAGRPGKLTLITRFGKGRAAALRSLVEAVHAAKLPVLWQCDPMHGNTIVTPSGLKTRAVEDIATEVREAHAVHCAVGSRLNGLHLEMTCDVVTECVGGTRGISAAELGRAYRTLCDPRLAGDQAAEVARVYASLENEFQYQHGTHEATRRSVRTVSR